MALRSHEQDSIRRCDRVLERRRLGRVFGVEVGTVEREVSDADLGELEVFGCQAYQRPGKHAVDRCGRETADEVADLVHTHFKLLPWNGT